MFQKHTIRILVVLAVVMLTVFGLIIVGRQFTNNRSTLGRMKRWCNGEYYVEQKANDLAYDLRHVLALAQIQPWALETMARFRAGQVKGHEENHLYWAKQVFLLAPEEMPAFIKAQLGETNKLGDVQPDGSIILLNGQPDYIVLDWGATYGIVIGPTNYEFSFAASGTNKVAPGIYTFFASY